MADATKSVTSSAGAAAGDVDPAELTKFVENMLEQMNQRFKAMSDTILSRIDEMGGRIEELEKSINDLTTQTSQGASSDAPAPSASS